MKVKMKVRLSKMVGKDEKYMPIFEDTEKDLHTDSLNDILELVRRKWKEGYCFVQIIVDEDTKIRFDSSCSGCRQGWGGVFGRIKK